MQINGPPLPPPAPSQNPGAEALNTRPWQAGDKLLATVLRLVDQGAVLAVGRQHVLARTQAPLQVGQHLRLEVVQPRSDPPILRILTATDRKNPAEQALRILLPRQSSLAPLLANLRLLADSAAGTRSGPAQTATTGLTTALSRPVIEQLQQWLRLLPDSAQASHPDGLKQALQDSGVFLEGRLARLLSATPGTQPDGLQRQAAQLLGGDLRAGLLRLAATLQASRAQPPATPPQSAALPGAQAKSASAPPAVTPAPLRGTSPHPQPQAAPTLATLPPSAAGHELLQQIEGALARIQLHQIQSQPQSQSQSSQSSAEATRAIWAMELPLRNGPQIDLFELHIQRDAGERKVTSTCSAVWSVILAFNLSELGAVRVHVSLYDGQVSAQFWVERPMTRQRFDAELATLRTHLGTAGLQVGRLGCQDGIPSDIPPPPPSGLVNEKA